MSIIKVVKQQGRFLVASVEIFEDNSLSFGARGLMAYLLTKPEGWEVRRDQLIKSSPAGKVAIQRMINELKQAGYVRRHQENDPITGKFITITDVYETKALNPDADIDVKSATPMSDLQVSSNNGQASTPTSGGPSETETTKPVHGNIHYQELPPEALPPGAYIPPDPESINSMISVLSGTCKGFANFILGEKCPFYQTAVRLIENGYTEENVMTFRDWWAKPNNQYYQGRASLKTLEHEIDNAVKGIEKSQGRPEDISKAINELDLFLARKMEFDDFSSQHSKAAVRAVGLGTIRSIGPGNRKSILRQFEDEFNNSRDSQ